MIKVWILLLLFNGDGRGYGTNGPGVIDNLASKAECERVGSYIMSTVNSGDVQTLAVRYSAGGYRCVEAWKVK